MGRAHRRVPHGPEQDEGLGQGHEGGRGEGGGVRGRGRG